MFGRGFSTAGRGVTGRKAGDVGMSVLLIAVVATIVVVWATVAVIVSVVVGRAISLAERRDAQDALPADDGVLAHHT